MEAVKTDNGLQVVGDIEEYNKCKRGTIFELVPRSSRKYSMLSKYWALCQVVANNIDEPWTKEQVSEYVKVKCQWVDYWFFVDDVMHVKTKTISYEISQQEFEEYYKRALPVLAAMIGVTPEELENNSR